MRPADLVIENARLWSEGGVLPGADTLAIAGGHIVARGTGRDLEGARGRDTRRIDARGCTVTPGITDAHLHLVAWARGLREVRLEGVRTRREAVAAVAAWLGEAPGDHLVVGRGWAADGWEAPPDHEALDAIAPRRPVLLHSKDYHAVWVNRAAMLEAGVHRGAEDPPGGKIERRPSGEPTGVFREHAVRLFDRLMPPPAIATDLPGVHDAVRRLLALGVTAIHDFEGDAEAEVVRAMADGEGPRVRVLMHLPRQALDRALSERVGHAPGGDSFAWGALKLFADGTLGSRTAAVLEPYDGVEEMGLWLLPPDELKGLVGRAVRGGLSVAVHAIGDRAVRGALDAFEDCGPALARLRLPPRIEHVQLVHEDDQPRFGQLGVVASMQPAHCPADRPLVERYWRSRARRSYPWRTLLDQGASLAFGSDAPVEPPCPAHGLHAAVTREHPDREGDAFVAMQRIALDEALTAYTETPARLAGAWPQRGRLAVGSSADLVVWDADLHRLPAASLHRVSPQATIVDGVVAFERAAQTADVATSARGGVR